jgi:hypothetical protein
LAEIYYPSVLVGKPPGDQEINPKVVYENTIPW